MEKVKLDPTTNEGSGITTIRAGIAIILAK